MKIIEPTHSLKPGAANNKNPLGVLIALAFFAGTPMWNGQQFQPLGIPETSKHPTSHKDGEK
ncbi:MAG TPA: hypothetical protein VGF61_03600 [Candidatus Acidoferrum sp.]|jgi:hypothetical protein